MIRKKILFFTLSFLAWAALAAVPVPQVHAAFFITPDAYWQFSEAAPPYSDDLAVPATSNNAASVPASGASPFTTNPVQDASGQVGTAVAFGGTSGLWALDGGTEVWDWAADASFAIEVWMKRAPGGLDTNGETEVLIGRNDTGSSNVHWFIGLRYSTGIGSGPRVIAQLRDADNEGSSITLNGTNTNFANVVDGNWHQVMLVRDAATLKDLLYVDGQLEDSATVDYTAVGSSGFEATVSSLDFGWLGIQGNTQTDFAFNGSIDQVAMYGSAPSAAEVEQIYQIGLSGHALNDDFAPIFSAGTTDLGVSAVGYEVTADAIPAANPAPTAYSLVSAPTGMTVDNSGHVSWTPTSQQTGVANFSVSATNTIGSGSGDYTIDIVDPCSTDLDAYWHLEEDGASGYANSEGTASLAGQCASGGCPAQDTSTGKVNNAQTFSGSNGIDVLASASANTPFDWTASSSFTIEFWMKRGSTGLPNNNDTEVMIGRWDSPNQLQWWVGVRRIGAGGPLRIAAKLIALGGENDVLIANAATGTNVTDGQWHHVALVRDYLATETRLYVDGVQEATDTHDYSADFTSADADLNLGYLSGGSFGFTGSLDEVALYADVLDANVLLQHATLNPGRGYCNSSPVVTSGAVTTADPTADYSYDADASDADGDSVTWSLVTGPTGMTIDSNSGLVSWAQADVASAAGTTVPVEIQVTDAYGGVGTQAFNIVVSGTANTAPQITAQQTLTTAQDTALTITTSNLTIVDPDSSSFILTVMDGTNYTRSGATITPASGFTGDLTVPVKVNDGISDSNTFSLTVTVTAAGSSGGGGGGGGGCFIATSASAEIPAAMKWFGLLSLAGLFAGAALSGRKN